MAEELSKAERIIKKCGQLEAIRKPREAVWNDIIDYILPGLETLLINEISPLGNRQGTNRYDGTGVSALQLFASGLFGYLVSPNLNWLRFRMRDNELGELPEVRQYLQDLEDHFYALFAQTNFYQAISMLFERAPAFGFASIYSEEDLNKGKIVFTVHHPGTLYVAESKYGIADTVYRKTMMEIEIAISKFGKDKFDQNILELAERNPYEKYEFIHAIYPRKNRIEGRLDAKNKPFESVWVATSMEPKAGDENGRLVEESGYNMNPYHVWRFKPGVTAYGQGPGEDALVEVMGANTIQKTMLKAGELAVNPAYNAPAELKGKINVNPGKFTYYNDPAKVVKPVQTGVKYQIGDVERARLKQAIEDHFQIGFFTLLAQYEGQPRSATEIVELQGEKAAVLGRPINSLNTECLNPNIDRIWMIEDEAGRLPEPPGILLEQGATIEVDYMGPLAQAQKKLHETQGIRYGLEQVAGLMEMFPDIQTKLIKPLVVGRNMLRTANFPQDAIVGKEEADKILQAEMAAMQQETAKEDLEGMAGTVKTLADADKATEGKLTDALGGAGGEAA